jgi:hypothetical protein
MRTFHRLSVITIIACLVVNCSSEHENPFVAATNSYLQSDSAGVLSESATGVRCSNNFLLTAFNYNESGSGCTRRVADTNSYSWRSVGNTILVRGREVRVSAQRLRPLGDSLLQNLTKQYGNGTSCMQLKDFARRSTQFHRWRINGRTIFLRAIIIESSPTDAITIESDSGDRACRNIVGVGPEWY